MLKRAKMASFGQNWHKTLRKLWKTQVFPLTLPGVKPHCYERRVIRTRMNTGVSCTKIIRWAFPGCGSRNAKKSTRQHRRPEGCANKEKNRMATGMTKTALVRHMAEKLQITNK